MSDFSKQEYANLAAIVSQARSDGVQQAAIVVTLYDKLSKLAQTDPPAAAPLKDETPSNDNGTTGT